MSFAILKRTAPSYATGTVENPYRTIVVKGFNHAAINAVQSGHKNVCVMIDGQIVKATVTECKEAHAVLSTERGIYGMTF